MTACLTHATTTGPYFASEARNKKTESPALHLNKTHTQVKHVLHGCHTGLDKKHAEMKK